MSSRTSPSTGLAAVGLAAVAWGTGGAVAALLYRTGGLGPVAVSFWRLAIGVTLLAVALHVRRRSPLFVASRLRRGPRPVAAHGHGMARGRGAVLIATGVGLAVYQTAFYMAIAGTGLAVATVVTLGAGPVLIAVGGRLLLGERLGIAGTAAVVLALAGLVLLTADGGSGGPRPAAGLAWALLSAAGYAVVTLLTRGAGADTDPYDSALSGLAVAGLCLLPLALAEGLLPARAGLGGTVAWLIFLGAVPTALAYGLFFAGLRHIRAATASVVALVEPVTAAVLAVLLLGERLSVRTVVGTAVLLGAVAALVAAERRTTRPVPALAATVPAADRPG